jgi:hypothetical protein
MTNGLIPAGTYTFDSTGVMLNPPEVAVGQDTGDLTWEFGTFGDPEVNTDPSSKDTTPATVPGSVESVTEAGGSGEAGLPSGGNTWPSEEETTSAAGQSTGCQSVVGVGFLALVLPALCAVSRKKRNGDSSSDSSSSSSSHNDDSLQ